MLVALSLQLNTVTHAHTHTAGAAGEEEGPEDGYRQALVDFQLDQIKITKEYQKVIGEKDAEVSSPANSVVVQSGDQNADHIINDIGFVLLLHATPLTHPIHSSGKSEKCMKKTQERS